MQFVFLTRIEKGHGFEHGIPGQTTLAEFTEVEIRLTSNGRCPPIYLEAAGVGFFQHNKSGMEHV